MANCRRDEKISWVHWAKERDLDLFAVLLSCLAGLIYIFVSVGGLS